MAGNRPVPEQRPEAKNVLAHQQEMGIAIDVHLER
jgi:hypothetical protein